MNDYASLKLGTPTANLRFDWLEYDGDDCFAQHLISFNGSDESKVFHFGACALRCIRKIESLLNAEAVSVGFGFRIPEIIYYDLHRTDHVLKLHVYSEQLGLDDTREVDIADVTFDTPFRLYYNRK